LLEEAPPFQAVLATCVQFERRVAGAKVFRSPCSLPRKQKKPGHPSLCPSRPTPRAFKNTESKHKGHKGHEGRQEKKQAGYGLFGFFFTFVSFVLQFLLLVESSKSF